MLKKLLIASLLLLGLNNSHYSYSMEKRGVKRSADAMANNLTLDVLAQVALAEPEQNPFPKKKPVFLKAPWKCNQLKPNGSPCRKTFTRHREYCDHVNGHLLKADLINAPYVCTICSYGIAQKSNIYRHVRNHFPSKVSLEEIKKHIVVNNPYDNYESQLGDGTGDESEEKEDNEASDSGETTESCYYEDEGDDESDKADSAPNEEEEEEIIESGKVGGYPLLSCNQSLSDGSTSGSGNITYHEEEEEEEESSDSDEPVLSPRSQASHLSKESVLETYTIVPSRRRKYTKHDGDGLWTCKKNKPDGTVCGKQFKYHADFMRHSNAPTKHQDGTLSYGYICTICHNYMGAVSSNVYNHIKMWHPGHENDTLNQLKQYVGILNLRESAASAPALQEEGQFKCTHEDCGRTYQYSSGLWKHLEQYPEHRQ